MQQTDIQWSDTERSIALNALKSAHDREVEALLKMVRESASAIVLIEDAWQLHDFLSAKRHEIEGRYDDRETFLLFTLSQLVKEGLLDITELTGLTQEKQAKVKVLSRM
ncbi:MAG: hypothetical protein AAF716_03150 [Cyanobacteria bacterium P01_D01_bin.1]